MHDHGPRPFDLTRPPVWRGGVIFCSPHSGRDYPDWFLRESVLDPLALRSSEDAFMDDLARPAVAAGAVLLTASLPRAVIDLNRAAHEIDPQAVAGAPPRALNPRTMAGLGVIPRVVSQGRAIRHDRIPYAEAQRRIALWWRPYHLTLAGLIAEAQAQFGAALVVDMHSMPGDALSHLHPPRPQVVIGNRNGVSAGREISAQVQDAFVAAGLRVRLNSPFSGAYIADAYGRPAQNSHVIQVEIDRSLYMDEARVRPGPNYAAFAAQLAGIIAAIAEIRPGGSVRVAAE
ncbi:MAG: N-formylglutamate amidohydrolase [Paracoccus sp. (in: a-proteobacteria)]|nr:N-formylglutamate amidohydrolase [Paracoccus sp. (in: a-proteobacteria)]